MRGIWPVCRDHCAELCAAIWRRLQWRRTDRVSGSCDAPHARTRRLCEAGASGGPGWESLGKLSEIHGDYLEPTDCSFIVSTAGAALWVASRGLAQRDLRIRGTAAGQQTCHRTNWTRPFVRPLCTAHDTWGTASDLGLCWGQLRDMKSANFLTTITRQAIKVAKR